MLFSSLKIKCLLSFIFFSALPNISFSELCNEVGRFNIPDGEYFVIPVKCPGVNNLTTKELDQLLCFAKFNLNYRRNLAVFLDHESSSFIGYSSKQGEKYKLHIHSKGSPITKSSIPEGVAALGGITKLGESDDVYLTRMDNWSFKCLSGDDLAYSVNFNVKTAGLGRKKSEL